MRSKGKLSISSAVELTIELADGTVGKVNLRATDVDHLISVLARIRLTMSPEMGRSLPESADTELVIDPLWALRTPHSVKDKILMLRHPGLGWAMFLLPTAEANRLGQALLSHAAPRSIPAKPFRDGALH